MRNLLTSRASEALFSARCRACGLLAGVLALIVASFASLDEPVRISAKELELSASLVDSFSSDFDPAEFTDEYQQELRVLIDAKLEKGDALDTSETFAAHDEEDAGGEVIDLMAALRASVERSRAARGEGSTEKKPTKDAAKTPAAKKTGDEKKSDKSAAKKPAAKKKAS